MKFIENASILISTHFLIFLPFLEHKSLIMIQHIFLDIGGVLINIHPDRCAQYWADSADLSLVKLKLLFLMKSTMPMKPAILQIMNFSLHLKKGYLIPVV